MITPRFQKIQIETDQPAKGIEREIWRLPQLSKKTMGRWADVVVTTVVEKKESELLSRGSRFYALANPERELMREKKRKARDLRKVIERCREKCMAEPNRAAVLETKLERDVERRRREIASMKVTIAHVKAGLREAILAFWERNLAT